MKRIQFTLVGLTPLLLDAMSGEQLEGLRTKKKVQIAKDITRDEAAKMKLYESPGLAEGKVQIPAGNLFASLKGAGRNVTLTGKKKVSTATTTELPSFFRLEDLWLDVVGDPETKEPAKYEADVRKGNLKQGAGGGVAVAIVRPKFDKWAIQGHFEYDDKVADDKTLKAVFESAGKSQGLCSFRPSKGGQFGMFKIHGWKDVTAAEAA